MSNKTSGKNVENDRIIAHKFAVMQQQINEKDKRIKELEEENSIQRKQIMNIFDNDYIPKQVVIDLICEIEDSKNTMSVRNTKNGLLIANAEINILKKLLEK